MVDDNAANEPDSALDEWDRELARSEGFWRMIHERRQEPTIPWEVVKEELGLDE
jgi:hypothetical protein